MDWMLDGVELNTSQDLHFGWSEALPEHSSTEPGGGQTCEAGMRDAMRASALPADGPQRRQSSCMVDMADLHNPEASPAAASVLQSAASNGSPMHSPAPEREPAERRSAPLQIRTRAAPDMWAPRTRDTSATYITSTASRSLSRSISREPTMPQTPASYLAKSPLSAQQSVGSVDRANFERLAVASQPGTATRLSMAGGSGLTLDMLRSSATDASGSATPFGSSTHPRSAPHTRELSTDGAGPYNTVAARDRQAWRVLAAAERAGDDTQPVMGEQPPRERAANTAGSPVGLAGGSTTDFFGTGATEGMAGSAFDIPDNPDCASEYAALVSQHENSAAPVYASDQQARSGGTVLTSEAPPTASGGATAQCANTASANALQRNSLVSHWLQRTVQSASAEDAPEAECAGTARSAGADFNASMSSASEEHSAAAGAPRRLCHSNSNIALANDAPLPRQQTAKGAAEGPGTFDDRNQGSLAPIQNVAAPVDADEQPAAVANDNANAPVPLKKSRSESMKKSHNKGARRRLDGDSATDIHM